MNPGTSVADACANKSIDPVDYARFCTQTGADVVPYVAGAAVAVFVLLVVAILLSRRQMRR